MRDLLHLSEGNRLAIRCELLKQVLEMLLDVVIACVNRLQGLGGLADIVKIDYTEHDDEHDDENVDLFEDSTRIALVKAIRALPALFAGAGDALVEFTAQIQDSSSFSAGKCKGQTTVANWHATLARRKANRM